MPFCPYLEMFLRRVLWLKKGTAFTFLSFGKDISGLLNLEGSPSELCKIHQKEKTEIGEKHAKALGLECVMAKSLTRAL